jgi:hypothetical protein
MHRLDIPETLVVCAFLAIAEGVYVVLGNA